MSYVRCDLRNNKARIQHKPYSEKKKKKKPCCSCELFDIKWRKTEEKKDITKCVRGSLKVGLVQSANLIKKETLLWYAQWLSRWIRSEFHTTKCDFSQLVDFKDYESYFASGGWLLSKKQYKNTWWYSNVRRRELQWRRGFKISIGIIILVLKCDVDMLGGTSSSLWTRIHLTVCDNDNVSSHAYKLARVYWNSNEVPLWHNPTSSLPTCRMKRGFAPTGWDLVTVATTTRHGSRWVHLSAAGLNQSRGQLRLKAEHTDCQGVKCLWRKEMIHI